MSRVRAKGSIVVFLVVLILTVGLIACGGVATSSPPTKTNQLNPGAGTPSPAPTSNLNPAPAPGPTLPPAPTPPPTVAPPPTPAPSPQPEPPTPQSASAIQSTSPKDGSTCISQNPAIHVTFRPDSAPAKVTSDNLQVTGPFGEQEGEVTWDAASHTATWRSGPILPRYTEGPDLGMRSSYKVTVSGFPGAPFSFSFQTGPCGPPSLYESTARVFDIPNARLTWIFGINNAGSLTGYYEDQNGDAHGFLYANNHLTDLKDLAYKLNDANAVVGIYGPNITGYLFRDGQYTDITYPAARVQGDQNWAYGINNDGVIVGRWNANHVSSFITSRGFLREANGTYREFNPTDQAALSSGTYPVDINNYGHAAGQSGDGSWYYNGETFAPVPVNDCASIQVEGLNDLDDVVGQANGCSTWNEQKTTGGSFIRRGSTFYQLTVPGCQRLQAFDVNSSGVVVGICTDQRGEHGFIITPK